MPGRGGDGTIMRFGIPEMLVNIAHFQKFCIGVNCRRGAKLLRVLDIPSIEGGQCHIIISISKTVIASLTRWDQNSIIMMTPPSAKAKVFAIGVSIDKPAVDPKRHIAVLNGLRDDFQGVRLFETINEQQLAIRPLL